VFLLVARAKQHNNKPKAALSKPFVNREELLQCLGVLSCVCVCVCVCALSREWFTALEPCCTLTVTVVCRLFPFRVNLGCFCSFSTNTRSDGALQGCMSSGTCHQCTDGMQVCRYACPVARAISALQVCMSRYACPVHCKYACPVARAISALLMPNVQDKCMRESDDPSMCGMDEKGIHSIAGMFRIDGPGDS